MSNAKRNKENKIRPKTTEVKADKETKRFTAKDVEHHQIQRIQEIQVNLQKTKKHKKTNPKDMEAYQALRPKIWTRGQ